MCGTLRRLTALVVITTNLLIASAAIGVSTNRAVVIAQSPVVPSNAPIPGFTKSVEMIRDLLNRGRGIEAENVARALLKKVEEVKGRDALEVAQVLDLLYRAVRASSKVSGEEKNDMVERAVMIKEQTLGPTHPDLATSLINLGIQRIVSGDLAAAKPVLERSVSIREAAFGPDHVAVAGALMPLGGLLLILRDDDEAKRVLERAQRIRENSYGGGHVDTVRTLVNLALLYQETSDYAGARERYERALALAEKLDRPDLPTMNVLAHAAVVLADLGGDYAGAARLNQRLLALCELIYRSPDERLRVPVHNLAIDLRELGDYQRAKVLAERSLEMAQQIFGPRHPEVATSTYVLATILAGLGEYSEAITLFDRATRLNEDVVRPPNPEVGRASWFIPGLFPLSGYTSDDAMLFEQAVAIRERLRIPGEIGTAPSLSNLAALLSSTSDFNRTRPLFEHALESEEKFRGPEHPEVASAASNLAYVLSHLGDDAGASELYSRALRIWEKSFDSDHPKVATALVNLAGLQLKTRHYDEAKPLLTRALKIQQQKLGPEHPDVAATLVNLAEADAHTRDTAEAFDAAARAAQISGEHVRLAARALPERQALAYASSSASGIDLLLTIASSRGGTDSTATAWNAIVRARGMVLDEMAARNRVASAADNPDIVALTQALTSARQRLAAAVVRGPGDAAPERYRAQLDQARKDKEGAERELAEKSALFRKDLSKSHVGLKEVGAALPDSTALVAFVRFQRHRLEVVAAQSGPDTEPAYVAFVMRAGEPPAVVPLGSAAKIDGLISRWRRQLDQEAMAAGRSSGLTEAAYRRVAGQLREVIWDPLRIHLANTTRVFIIPDGGLDLVNFASLPEGTAKYLVETGPLIHYLSAERDVVSMETTPPPAGAGLLALGGVAFDESNRAALPADTQHFRGTRSNCISFQSMQFDPLPASLAEVNQVVSLWNGTHGSSTPQAAPAADVLRLTGTAASESALKSEAVGRQVLHLATHGFFLGGDCAPDTDAASTRPAELPTRIVKENPLVLSGLVLAGANKRNSAPLDQEDGVLTAEEVAALNLSGVEWVVLSGCDTGAGEVKAGEGVFGLRRAFQIAGARTVIMSLWPVEDQSTRRWMKALYDGRLTKKLGTAEAVREASLELLRQRRAQGLPTHPFYWAGFVAAGDWR